MYREGILRRVNTKYCTAAELMCGIGALVSLDELLKGGIREGQHTELVGESGSGKTQVRGLKPCNECVRC